MADQLDRIVSGPWFGTRPAVEGQPIREPACDELPVKRRCEVVVVTDEEFDELMARLTAEAHRGIFPAPPPPETGDEGHVVAHAEYGAGAH
ncbi:hypothetical protein ABZV77_01475 [Streptomyces sp. NPDC004732]|uniref:hypothetical protein n=1 Tax=Streptomyces sp. NPDC004732 TaxID=3154290 RepID=UPI0033AB479D